MTVKSKLRGGDRFLRNLSILMILSLMTLELLPYLGFPSYNIESIFTIQSLSLILKILILCFLLIGVLSLILEKNSYIIFPLLASAWEVTLGAMTIFNSLSGGFSLSSLTGGLTVTVLGFIACLSLLLLNRHNPRAEASLYYKLFGSESAEYAVELVDLVKKYFIGEIVVPAINGVNLKVKRGEFISIMGPSGCGKSTLLNLIGALDRPTSGKVLIDGVDISTLNPKSLARLRNEKIGFVFQAYNLINRSTVYRNIELPMLVRGVSKNERRRRVMELLEIVGLSDKMYRRPRMLSGGEQQRVAIARAIVNNPSIILADEPTGNLDSKAGRNIIQFMKRLNREFGTTIIIVTHDREVAEMTDRIVYLKDGRIVGEKINEGNVEK